MSSANPAWVDIAAGLRSRVAAGEWRPGEQLPSMRRLADEYGVGSHAPVNRAIMVLVSEGILTTDPAAPRRGVRVRSTQVLTRDLFGNSVLPLTFEDETGADGVEVTVTYDWVEATADLATSLQVSEGTELLARTFRYTLDGTPHQVAREYMRADLARECGLTGPDAEVPGRNTAMWLERAGIHLHREHLVLLTRNPTAEERDALAVPIGVPVYEKTLTTYDESDSPLDTRRILVVADRIIYTADRVHPRRTDSADPAGADQC
ncbi:MULTISPECIES: GntR family transcriptional regulator [Nocardia]|uniref:GntR family transcriptional regulator n=1 Tax=Nocardia TaxID=1817 RepID=UPI000322F49E|nr:MULTISPECIES: GntR family transcriptional regulator [Nocardia]MBF6189117.1 GntR family transcriptional regulator [Nocardia farcinica]MBF6246402.1 GntR family transcriptional regulator [Nocardia elegans]MBF6314943.1 GntR family transcriptional regulator [Nocardia farcinica]MBF6411465.1 GntR family transcriptional regulator [Nocardia farcinica]UEX26256.1 GntR family transcriptional regulator [Nocardia farcinica]